MASSRLDPGLRAEFKEIARSIISRDRHANKSGRSQNTIGEIERALVRAYALGKEHGASPPKSQPAAEAGEALDWILIPPRARDVLSSMTTSFSPRWGRPDGKPSEIEWFMEGVRRRWRVVSHRQAELDRSVADSSVQPLVRLGLLEPADEEQQTFVLTDKGAATGREYWRREDADDPTLPKISLR